MAWDHLAIDKPHLVYIILGGFTSLFMLCSSVIKERLYIGEATVATICGIIFGPHAANLIDPGSWGNTDLITLEFARIVLVVQCFAVGVELPKAYMERHWKSVVLLLVPVMTFGWLVTSLFIWAVFHNQLSWLDSLTCAACVTATDPVLASSVVGKGKFAKRVPKHLRDLLSAESGCNDGMAFPFIYLALYIVVYRPNAGEVSLNWFCTTILYECIFGAIYGVIIGYAARRAIRYAHEKDLIDRESFLVFYFVLALFCAGSGSILGIDDLLVGFACGVGFSNDGWFMEKTEESHVSNVIDLLINLTFFVYFGTIIPWGDYNSSALGIEAWKLVVIAFLVLFFRRIPIMLALKPIIPDVKTWREALFAGHFGPIGVGALFVAILARAELENGTTEPDASLPLPGTNRFSNIIQLIWPITTFLVLTSIIVHGSSIAVFTLGKHINTLTITMSYTQGNDEMSWMERLPRIQSRSKSSMSLQKPEASSNDHLAYPQAALGLPNTFLRRQREEDPESRSSIARPHTRARWAHRGFGAGGPISQSAIAPQPRKEDLSLTYENEKSESDTLAMGSEVSPESKQESPEPRSPMDEMDSNGYYGHGYKQKPSGEIYQEGNKTVIEDEEGNVLDVMESHEGETEHERKRRIAHEARYLFGEKGAELHKTIDSEHEESNEKEKNLDKTLEEQGLENDGFVSSEDRNDKDENDNMPQRQALSDQQEPTNAFRQRVNTWASRFSSPSGRPPQKDIAVEQPKRGPARAFRFGRTVIVEDEDGEVIKKYELPPRPKREKRLYVGQGEQELDSTRDRLYRVGTWLGISGDGERDGTEALDEPATAADQGLSSDERPMNLVAGKDDDDDDGIRFTVPGNSRRMSKAEFIRQLQSMDPKSRAEVVGEANKRPSFIERASQLVIGRSSTDADRDGNESGRRPSTFDVEQKQSHVENAKEAMDKTTSNVEEIPHHSVSDDLRRAVYSGQETAAQRRRRAVLQSQTQLDEGSNKDGAARATSIRPEQETAKMLHEPARIVHRPSVQEDDVETAAERRRREAALGISKEDSDSDDELASQMRQRRTTNAEMRRVGVDSPQSMRSPQQQHRQREFAQTRDSHQSPSISPGSTRAVGIRFVDQPARPNSIAAVASTTTLGSSSGIGTGGGSASQATWRERMMSRRSDQT